MALAVAMEGEGEVEEDIGEDSVAEVVEVDRRHLLLGSGEGARGLRQVTREVEVVGVGTEVMAVGTADEEGAGRIRAGKKKYGEGLARSLIIGGGGGGCKLQVEANEWWEKTRDPRLYSNTLARLS